MPDQCANCGFVNPPGMRFCGNCGSRLTDQVPESAPSVQSIQQQIGTMVGADLLERFRKAGLEARGQRRNVTVLFADISGYTSLANRMDNEDLFDLVQRFSNLLANDVYKYDGIVDKFTGDGIMALFGAPIANENNAELAVFSGLDMLADVTQLNQDMRHLLDIPLPPNPELSWSANQCTTRCARCLTPTRFSTCG
jgi:predicted  nucleic acid-binding Zn-ribbon protein